MADTATEILGEDRETFMARVRDALGHAETTPPTAPEPPADETLIRLAGENDDLVKLFVDRARGAGVTVHRITFDDLSSTLLVVLVRLRVKHAVLAINSLKVGFDIEATLQSSGIEVLDWRARPGFEAHYSMDAGITDVHAALAESGTLICNSDSDHCRATSLVPSHHIAIVRQSDILPDMIDYWATLKGVAGTDLSSSIAFITGPSKTADIEGELITGVHGPEDVHVLLIEGV